MSNSLTFLFTDLENSTYLWEKYPDEMQTVMARHDAILKDVIQQCSGNIIKSTGDGFHAYFDSAKDGILAAIQAQCALKNEDWDENDFKVKVRIGMHTGESEQRAGDYYGTTVNRAARMMDIAHGGQVLASEATVSLSKHSLPSDIFLVDKGQHRLKGIAQLEHVYQISSPGLENEFPPLRSLATFKHNLPRQLTSFVGREKELVEIQRLMESAQLLTLLGPGGTGKTRLMLQSAEEMIQDFPDGVWLVELATLTNPSKIPDRVAAALNLQEQPTRKIIDTLFDYLRQKELLLLIDNVEHLIRECAIFVEELLNQCPNIKVMVTGREALFISGETTLQIPSLGLPDITQNLAIDEIRCAESVNLFMERAQSVRPDFTLTQFNATTIADIVKRLDGIPLALELAAARLRMLSVEQIAERLTDRFRLLTGGNRTALPRQQTLQALIDWSWNLLDEEEHILLRRLSVFSGGWTLKAAESIAGFDPLDEYMVFDLLEQLINKSVVNVTYPPEGSARYNLLESIRQYAQNKLIEADESEVLRNRHAEFFLQFAERDGRQLRTSEMVKNIKMIEKEFENIRAVMTWTLETNPVFALRISGSLLYWPAHWIQLSEAKSWLVNSFKQIEKIPEPEKNGLQVEDLIKGHISLATISSMYSDHIPALENINIALSLAESNEQLRHLAYAHVMKATILGNGAGPFTPDEWIPKIEKMIEICKEHNFDYELS
ncbi:MAG: adenylate/guanylate cyclase domain-containing protein [Anaerolineales bacterium]